MPKTKHIAPLKAGCLLRIKSAAEMFKPAEKSVAEFVLVNADQVMHMSVSEAARDIGVGESTVIRFCRALGYKGYQEFKLRLAQDLVEPVEFIHANISFADSTADLAQKVFQTNIKAVGDTMKAVDPEMVEVAAKALLGSWKSRHLWSRLLLIYCPRRKAKVRETWSHCRFLRRCPSAGDGGSLA